MIKLVMFDFDGVLVDSNRAWAEIYSKTAEATGIRKRCVKYEDIKAHYGKPYGEVIKAACPEAAEDDSVMENMYSNFVDLSSSEEFASSFDAIKGVRNSLRELKKKFKLAVGTGNSKRVINMFLSRFGMTKYFDLVVAGDDVENGKPNPDMLLKALDHFKIKPKEAVYVGDAKSDVIAAKRAGMRSVAVLTGAMSRLDAEKIDPDYIVEDATKVEEVVSCMS